ncbi:MAG: SMP-30/gluconolactonase/LRE family protein [Kordiimonas sp.]
MAELIDIIPVQNTLGEGVVWDERIGAVLWTDIQESKLFRLDFATRNVEKIKLPHRLCSFALTETPTQLLAAFDCGFALFDYRSGDLNWVAQPDSVNKTSGRRLNDGRVDPSGRFWCGGLVEAEGQDADADLFCLEDSGALSTKETGIAISNAICWNAGGNRMYFADSPTRAIYLYDIEQTTGEMSNRRLFAKTPEGAFPDGAVTDTHGQLWNAHWGAGQVVQYTLEGEVAQIVETPVTQPSCVAFGGPARDILFVTSARQGLSAEELVDDQHAGALLMYKTNTKGSAEPYFKASGLLTKNGK